MQSAEAAWGEQVEEAGRNKKRTGKTNRQGGGKQKGKGKGAGGKGAGGKGAKTGAALPQVPPGAKEVATSSNKPLCFAWNKGTCTRQNCKFEHLCWWCEAADHVGNNCSNKPS